ncbi:alpha/beta fold hydrolase [Oceanobacillus jeddahense]|uniref:Alpha/beta hydrolase n=1 Tax=Oceanobacillus jeddahense TaxID=1462527 RepID=A0ABY5JQ55_9BACI|nr:alpha/beta hydrolase [Oceanobacillus jeddahense]UUI02421.1 alpha/beta hydrolase [Oceanobacillus jeddahense]
MDLHYEIAGNGSPIVLVHSGGADLRDWTFVTPLLAKHYMVVSYDGRGAGKSPDPTGDMSCVEDLKKLLGHLNIHKTMLIGHSMGGQIATDFSLEYPEYVSELIVIAPALTGYNYSQDFVDYMNKVTAVAPDIEKMIEISQSAPSYRVVQASPHKELTDEMLRHHIKRMFQWPAFELIWPHPPAAERLGELTVKTLFIIGTEELPDNLRVADYFRKHSDARTVEISGADHMVTLTHPEELYHHIKEFLED